MTINLENGVPFDPGFVQHISGIIQNINYVYTELDRYKNFGQKKNQFKMIFPNLEKLINNYVGFYAGCILWAKVIKDMDKSVTGNFCFGGEYKEDETLQEVRFLREYLKALPKEVKYYIGKDYKIEDKDFEILDKYEEFLKENQGFIKVEKSSDLLVSKDLKFNADNDEILKKIEEVIDNGKLFELKELL